MGEWKRVKVGGLGNIVTGKTPKTSDFKNYGGTVPFLTPSDDMDKKKVKNTARTLSEIGVSTVKNNILPTNSICVSCIGSDLGKVVITTEPTVTNQQINSIILNEKYDVDFIYYLMIILGKKLNYISKTSTAVPIINKSEFSNYEIFVPEYEEQKKISSILSVFDDKIELNNRINDNLYCYLLLIFLYQIHQFHQKLILEEVSPAILPTSNFHQCYSLSSQTMAEWLC